MTARRATQAETATPAPASKAPDSQRIDKWLWCARFFKTRSLASKIANAGKMRLTRDGRTTRIDKASALVRPGDELAFTIGERLVIVAITACALRRGPAVEAQALYEDRSPPRAPKAGRPAIPAPAFEREKGDGRPTKKDRRALDKIQRPD